MAKRVVAQVRVASKKAQHKKGSLAKPTTNPAAKPNAPRSDLNAPVEVAMNTMTAPVREIAWKLDRLIRHCAGKRDLVSQVKWGNACYVVGGTDLFSIAGNKAYASLYVGNGAALLGPFTRVLEGNGTLMRHVKCRTLGDARREDVRSVIEASIALARVSGKTAWTKGPVSKSNSASATNAVTKKKAAKTARVSVKRDAKRT